MTSHSTLLPPSSTTQCPPSSDPCQDAFDTCANVLVFFQHRAHIDSDGVRLTGSWGGALEEGEGDICVLENLHAPGVCMSLQFLMSFRGHGTAL